MNIDGAVQLGYRKEVPAIEDPDVRFAEFERRAREADGSVKKVNTAAGGEINDVIDPSDTRLDCQQFETTVAGAGPDRGKVYLHRSVVRGRRAAKVINQLPETGTISRNKEGWGTTPRLALYFRHAGA